MRGLWTQNTGVYTPTIRFVPEPDAAYATEVWYYRIPLTLDADSEVWDGFNGWEEYATVFAATKLLQKEESDTSHLLLRLNQLSERIRDLSNNRDQGENEKVVDVEGTYGGDW